MVLTNISENRKNERGGAGVKVLITLAVLGLAFFAGLNYIPALYQSESIKQEMRTAYVNATMAPPPNIKPADAMRQKLRNVLTAEGFPADTYVDVRSVQNGVINARVYYIKEVDLLPFNIYKYKLTFDETVTAGGNFVPKPQ